MELQPAVNYHSRCSLNFEESWALQGSWSLTVSLLISLSFKPICELVWSQKYVKSILVQWKNWEDLWLVLLMIELVKPSLGLNSTTRQRLPPTHPKKYDTLCPWLDMSSKANGDLMLISSPPCWIWDGTLNVSSPTYTASSLIVVELHAKLCITLGLHQKINLQFHCRWGSWRR